METQIVNYNVTDAAIAKMDKIYMGLAITDIGSQEEFQAVHDARIIVKGKRIDVEKKRVQLKADSLVWGRKVDGEAKRITKLLEPIESHLSAQEKKVTDEQKRIAAEEEELAQAKIDARVAELFKINYMIPFMEVAALSDDEYAILLAEKKEAYEAEQKRLADEEAARVVENERLEKLRIEQEAESKRLQKIADDLDAEKQKVKDEKERLDRLEFERVAKAKAEAKAKSDARKAEDERVRQEKANKIAAEFALKNFRFVALAKIGFKYGFDDLGVMKTEEYDVLYAEHLEVYNQKQVKIETERLEKERLEKEKAEAEEKERQAAMAPDKEQLGLWVNQIEDLSQAKLSLKSAVARDLQGQIETRLGNMEEWARQEIENL